MVYHNHSKTKKTTKHDVKPGIQKYFPAEVKDSSHL